jgi:hypothetical protein
MVCSLPTPHLRLDGDLMRVRRLLEWHEAEYDGRIWCRTIPLAGIRPDENILFTSYSLVGIAFLTSSFFLTLLENYGLQLHHLTSHALTLVAIFVHLCEMYAGMWSSVHLFWLFFVL